MVTRLQAVDQVAFVAPAIRDGWKRHAAGIVDILEKVEDGSDLMCVDPSLAPQPEDPSDLVCVDTCYLPDLSDELDKDLLRMCDNLLSDMRPKFLSTT